MVGPKKLVRRGKVYKTIKDGKFTHRGHIFKAKYFGVWAKPLENKTGRFEFPQDTSYREFKGITYLNEIRMWFKEYPSARKRTKKFTFENLTLKMLRKLHGSRQ